MKLGQTAVIAYLADCAIPPSTLAYVEFFSDATVVDDIYGAGTFSIALDMTGPKYVFQSIVRQYPDGHLTWWMAVFPIDEFGGKVLAQTEVTLSPTAKNLLKSGTTVFLGFNTADQSFTVSIPALGISQSFSTAGTAFAPYVLIPQIADLTIGGLMQGSNSMFTDLSAGGNINLGTTASAAGQIFKMPDVLGPGSQLTLQLCNITWQGIGEGSNAVMSNLSVGSANVSFLASS